MLYQGNHVQFRVPLVEHVLYEAIADWGVMYRATNNYFVAGGGASGFQSPNIFARVYSRASASDS